MADHPDTSRRFDRVLAVIRCITQEEAGTFLTKSAFLNGSSKEVVKKRLLSFDWYSNKRTGDPFELRRLDLRDSGAGDGGLMDSVIVSGNSVSGGNIERYEKVHVPITLCLLILIAYVTGGGLVFANWENWSRIEGIRLI